MRILLARITGGLTRARFGNRGYSPIFVCANKILTANLHAFKKIRGALRDERFVFGGAHYAP